MKISLKKLDFEIKEMFRIGKLIGTDKITDADVNFLLKQATDGVPVSEFQYGLYLLLNLNKKEEAIVYFEKFLKHANGYGLWEASGRFAKLFDDLNDYDWYEWSMKCLRRSAWRQFKIAKMMLKDMKENPFHFPQA